LEKDIPPFFTGGRLSWKIKKPDDDPEEMKIKTGAEYYGERDENKIQLTCDSDLFFNINMCFIILQQRDNSRLLFFSFPFVFYRSLFLSKINFIYCGPWKSIASDW